MFGRVRGADRPGKRRVRRERAFSRFGTARYERVREIDRVPGKERAFAKSKRLFDGSTRTARAAGATSATCLTLTLT